MKTPNMISMISEGVELTRNYAFRFCSPSRSALHTGRLPYHVNQDNSAEWGWDSAPVDLRMKMLPERLREAGYYSHQFGKWHLGLAKQGFTPAGRGYDDSLGFLAGSEDHWDHMDAANGKHAVDLWNTDKNALGYNGTYSAEIYASAAVDVITNWEKNHGSDTPLFMYFALAVTHAPIQAPDRFTNMYPSSWISGRQVYGGMTSAADEAVGNLTRALKQTGMWNNTILFLSSDNGGPALVGGPSYANNYPLRGSKGNDFEGGTRVSAFVSGGRIPPSARGTKCDATMHLADIYCTALKQAGIMTCDDGAQGVPPVESYDMWPSIVNGAPSPRPELVLRYLNDSKPGELFDAAIIDVPSQMKYIQGAQEGTGWWWSPNYPNSTARIPSTAPGCPNGCLYNITADPSELYDLSSQLPELKAKLKARLYELGKSQYQSDASGHYDYAGAIAGIKDGYWNPWLN